MKSLLIKSHLAEKSKLEKMRVIDNPADLAQVSGSGPDCETTVIISLVYDWPTNKFNIVKTLDETCVEVLDDGGAA